MSNDDIIRKTAIEFINCYWNIPYHINNTFIEYLGSHIGQPDLTLDEYITMLNADIEECCFVLSEFAIDDHGTFMYFVDRIKDEMVHIDGVDKDEVSDWRSVVTIIYNAEDSTGRQQRMTKYFVIADDCYFEAYEKQVITREWRA